MRLGLVGPLRSIHRCSNVQASHHLPTSLPPTPGNWWILLGRNYIANQRAKTQISPKTQPGPCLILIYEKTTKNDSIFQKCLCLNSETKPNRLGGKGIHRKQRQHRKEKNYIKTSKLVSQRIFIEKTVHLQNTEQVLHTRNNEKTIQRTFR